MAKGDFYLFPTQRVGELNHAGLKTDSSLYI